MAQRRLVEVVISRAPPPGQRGAEADQERAGEQREDAGEVAVCWCVELDVDGVHRAVDERGDAEADRDRRAQPGAQPRERDDGSGTREQREQAGECVLAEADAGLAPEEGVVERVHDGDGHGDDEQQRFAAAMAVIEEHGASLDGVDSRVIGAGP